MSLFEDPEIEFLGSTFDKFIAVVLYNDTVQGFHLAVQDCWVTIPLNTSFAVMLIHIN